ncbi:MAG: hypothetical protein IJW16_06035 [Clostridia bacterium]|nr:hypothetical protein [Clostridia bacterium]
MRKIISALLALCMLLGAMSLSSCAEKSSKELIDDAIEKTEGLASGEQKGTITLAFTMDGKRVEVPISIHVKGEDLDTSSPKIYERMTVRSADLKYYNATMYADKDWVYLRQNGVERKMTWGEAGQFGMHPEKDSISVMKKLPSAALVKAKSIKNEDGSRTVKAELDGDEMQSTYYDLLDAVKDLSGFDKCTCGDGEVEVTVKNGYITEYNIESKINCKTGNLIIEADMSVKFEIVDPGKAVYVKIPAEYMSFPLASE